MMVLVRLLLIVALFPIAAQGAQSTEAGKTIMARGTVEAFDAPSQKRLLQRRSPIFNIDTVTTDINSLAQIRMIDDSLLALKANSQLIVSEYEFNPETLDGSAVMQLVEGGLRAVTGSIKAKQGNYRIETPVGSIGIRGTHFEIELIDGDMFVAVWDGAIDLAVQASGDSVSFGAGEDFAFGIISQNGDVTGLLEAPDNFDSGHTPRPEGGNASQNSGQNLALGSDDNDVGQSLTTSDEPDSPSAQNNETDSTPESVKDNLPINDDLREMVIEENVDEAFDDFYTPASPEIIASRSGEFSFSSLVASNIAGSGSNLGELSLSMEINFDEGTVPLGELSINDDQGEWFAAFNGLINRNQLELGINFATHGNALASGTIGALFTDGGNKLSGQFSLQERENPDVFVRGDFLLR